MLRTGIYDHNYDDSYDIRSSIDKESITDGTDINTLKIWVMNGNLVVSNDGSTSKVLNRISLSIDEDGWLVASATTQELIDSISYDEPTKQIILDR